MQLPGHLFDAIQLYSVWVFKCLFRWLDWEKNLEHCLQGNGFSPVCVLRCFFKSPFWENDFEHSLHVNGFSPECVLWWLLRLLASENDLEHSLQLNGFSPVCVLRWAFILLELEKLLGHCSQGYFAKSALLILFVIPVNQTLCLLSRVYGQLLLLFSVPNVYLLTFSNVMENPLTTYLSFVICFVFCKFLEHVTICEGNTYRQIVIKHLNINTFKIYDRVTLEICQ